MHPRRLLVPLALLASSITAALLLVACSGSSKGRSVQVEPTGASATATAGPPPTATPEPVTHLLFTGDVIPARCVYARIKALGGDWTLPFQPLHDMLNAADLTIGTLDATIADAGTPIGCVETFSLMGPAAAARGLGYAGYDVISHAANHIKDCGESACGDNAMIQTDINLRAQGVLTVGDGANLADARKPVVVERNGIRFAFLAYDDIADYYHATADSAGSAPLDPATVGEDIAAARRVADVVIVIPHWGIEYTIAPSDRQRAFARAAAAAGADLVIGNHPHWVQAHEQIGNTFVAYALGNFVFDQDWSLETQQGALLDVTFTGTKVTATKYTPIHIYDQYQPRLAPPDEAASIMQRVDAASAALAAGQ